MNESPAIKSIVPWFGSKRRLASTIVEQLGPHRMYLEPFCGSLAVLGNKTSSNIEIVNDLNGDLINLARCIQHPRHGPALYKRLRRTLMSDVLFEESAMYIREFTQIWDGPEGGDEQPERAFHYFVYAWLGMNGTLGTTKAGYAYCVRYTANGGSPGKRFRGAIHSIPWWRKRLDQVCILRRDAFVLLDRIDDSPTTAIYCDPPYIEKSAAYVHDFKPRDHERLAKALSRFKSARVVVSYYDHPDLKAFYSGWTRLNIDISKALAQSGRRDGKADVRAKEVLLINGSLNKSLVTDGMLF